MFSRRHPYLFFLIVITSVVSVAMLGMSVLFFLGFKRSEFDFGEKVGIIEINGAILDSEPIIQDLRRFRENEAIKAIVLRIDSPGGGVGPSQEIYREIQKTTPVKNVIASLGSVAASGGYYVAAPTNGIVANPGTITGSIGVIMGFTNFKALLDKIGLTPVVIKSGEYKDTGSPVRAMTDDERAILQSFVDGVHRQFVAAVAEGRQMGLDQVNAIADGRIFSGETARDLGLVDRIGNLDDAVEWAGRLGGIEGKISTVRSKKEKLSFLRYVIDSALTHVAHHLMHSNPVAGYVYQPLDR